MLERVGFTSRGGGRHARLGFTIVELLIVVTMIGVLVGIVLPVLGRTLEAGRSFKCRMSMRSVAMDFQFFGDRELHGDRGNDRHLGERHFYLETFQESQYGIDEFWKWGDANTHNLPDAAGNNPMRCPSVDGDLVLSKGKPCSGGAISPKENVSFGFNARLHRPEVVGDNGQISAPKARLSSRIFEEPMVPLLWDVDGREAAEHGVEPVFSAPALDSEVFYANDLFWFPGARHNGAMNVAFIGGHVLSSGRPLREGDWRWEFQPLD